MCAIRRKRLAVKCLLFLGVSFILIMVSGCHGERESSMFKVDMVDPTGPNSPWGKSVGDVDGDGDLDILVGGNQANSPGLWERVLRKLKLKSWDGKGADLVWYENPGWIKHLISDQFNVRTDLEVGDVDGDGVNDIVATTNQGLVIFYGPDWKPEIIDSLVLHDIELSDLDRDGRLDLAVRDQTLFGHNRGHELVIYWQQTHGWDKQHFTVPEGEGLKVADLNGDDYPDIVVNQIFLQNPGGQAKGEWLKQHYALEWTWQHTYIDVADIDQDTWPDILLSPSEPAGLNYRISWFRNPGQPGESWQEVIVDPQVETVHHFIGAGDWEGDGDVDIFSAEMNQGSNANEVKVYLNDGSHRNWQKLVLGNHGSHSMRVADFDGDFDAEVVGANWHIEGHEGPYPVILWDAGEKAQTRLWRVYQIADTDPARMLFIHTGDLDQDGYEDIAAGGFWYRNPHRISGHWEAHAWGGELNNIILIHDFDQDNKLDVLGSRWDALIRQPSLYLRLRHKLSGKAYPGSLPGNELLWAKNSGRGEFRIFNNIEKAQGDFLQGAAIVSDKNQKGVALSWHKSGFGVQWVKIPIHATEALWSWDKLSDISQDEALSVADLNRDGLDDLVLGTIWLNQAAGWKAESMTDLKVKPDRNRVADLNGDGWLDVVIGEEAVDRLGKVLWLENPGEKQGTWPAHQIGMFFGPMSLDLGDLDEDGDLDIVVGEHRLKAPEKARVIWLENRDGVGELWVPKLIGVGFEHHDGTQLADLDRDGDLDIVSIGFGHSKVIVYENPFEIRISLIRSAARPSP